MNLEVICAEYRPRHAAYDRWVRGRRLALAACAVGLVASQAGHLLAFQLRFGSAAQHLQSSGAHAYFPLLAKTALGLVALALVAAMFVIGLARMLAGSSTMRGSSPHAYIELLAALFTVQLVCFIAQEAGEAIVAGTPVDSASHLLLWGTLGQLPVAALAAIALRWLWTRFESAVQDLRAVLAVTPAPQFATALAVAASLAADHRLLLAQVAGGSLAKRGPPSSSRISR
jgi:hypothetical protein